MPAAWVDIEAGGSKRRPPVIALEMILAPDWMAGTIYLRNLVYCLASLASAERPDVRLIGVADPQHPVVTELRKFDFVDRQIGSTARNFARLSRGLARRIAPRLMGWSRGAHELDVIYPSFGNATQGAAAMHWIPDFQHVHMPQFFTADERHARDANVAAVARKRGVLVLSSRAAQRDFAAIHPHPVIESHVWPFCTVITANELGGADPHVRYDLPDRYVYVANQFWAHKNHETAFRALALLKATPNLVFVCTGLEEDRRDPDYMPRLRALMADLKIDKQVRLLGLVPRNDQIQIFRHATLVLQPSLFEGWSTVVEDAKSLGRPVLASDIAVHREQFENFAEGAARFFPPRDHQALAAALADWWHKLPSGPQRAAEQAADAHNAVRRTEAGRAFLRIVERAIAIEQAMRRAGPESQEDLRSGNTGLRP